MKKLIGKRYEIFSRLGSGSIGDVYLAIDIRNGEKLCLKILKSDIAQHFQENFAREFELLSQLNHPCLIPVYDFGIDDDNGPFFSMEYAAGGDLSQVDGISPEEFYNIASSVCRALEYIHNHGVVHGDIKPGNILIDSQNSYRLVDFGLSFITGQNLMTSSGSAVFVSPEVIHKHTATNRSDIYSLGLLFYELVFGKPFYEGSAGEIISKKLSGPISLPDFPEEFGGKAIKGLVRRMIDPDPHNRIKSAGTVLDSIETVFRDYSITGESRKYPVEKSKFIGRKEELNWLLGSLKAPHRKGDNLLFIGGDSGVGKSRLVDEFRIKAQVEGFRFYKAFCREGDYKPLSPVINLLNYVFTELDPHMEIFAGYGPDLKRLFPEKFGEISHEKYEMSEAEVNAGRRRIFDNLVLYLSRISSDEKLILFIEECQWADNETLEFIKFLKNYPADCGNLIFICAGQKNTEDLKNMGFADDDNSLYRILEPSDQKNMAEFIDGLLKGIELPSEFYDRLYEETGGNFLYAEEIIKALSSDGQFARERGRWVLKPRWEDKIDVPQGVKTLLERKLERLDKRDREIVELAAVLANSFTRDEFENLLGNGSIVSNIDGLISAGVLDKSEIGGRERIHFASGQLGKLIYSSIPGEKLRIIHAGIAQYYSEAGASPEFLGRHFASAGDYQKGYYYLFESAVSAEKVFSFNQASRFYETARSCAEQLPRSKTRDLNVFQSLLGYGKAMNSLSPAEASEPLHEAFNLAQSQFGVSPQLAEAGVILGKNHLNIGHNQEAEETYTSVLSAVQSMADRRLEGRP
jgi:serine/threonine protein kinase